MSTPTAAVVLGTRPEAIKLAELVERLGPQAWVVHTGQHFDTAMADDVERDLGLAAPAHRLAVGGRRRGEQIGDATSALTELFARQRPGAVVVQGDTNTALAAALAANAEEIPLVHVEAGLRSFDRAMPEEHNRVLIDHVADVCAAPTDGAADHLRAEGIDERRIEVTGNTIVEAVHRLLPEPADRQHLCSELGLEPGRFVVSTLHRPENVDDPDRLAALLEQLGSLPLPVVLPLHPRTRDRVAAFGLGSLLAPLTLTEPVPPRRFLGLAAECALVVSDSGGIQEEVSVLKRYVLVVRRSTERPEAIGTFSELCRPDEVLDRAAAALERAADLTEVPCPFGDGRASERIAERVTGLLATPG